MDFSTLQSTPTFQGTFMATPGATWNIREEYEELHQEQYAFHNALAKCYCQTCMLQPLNTSPDYHQVQQQQPTIQPAIQPLQAEPATIPPKQASERQIFRSHTPTPANQEEVGPSQSQQEHGLQAEQGLQKPYSEPQQQEQGLYQGQDVLEKPIRKSHGHLIFERSTFTWQTLLLASYLPAITRGIFRLASRQSPDHPDGQQQLRLKGFGIKFRDTG